MTMKTLPKTLALGAAAGLFALSGLAQGQGATADGEQSGVLVCFYECKDGYQPDWWQEVTTLMVENPTPTVLDPDYYFLDGNGTAIARTFEQMGSYDVDEINVCRTLQAAGITPPSAGMIVLTAGTTDPNVAPDGTPLPPTQVDPFSPYAYMKNVVGKFFKTVDEPFAGRVTGIGKTECRVVPTGMVLSTQVKTDLVSAPVVTPVLIEDTDEGPIP